MIAETLHNSGQQIIDSKRRRAAESYELREVDWQIKEDQRQSVLKFLLSHHHQEEFCLLSLPDEKWTFERLVECSVEKSRFLGLQWSWMHLERGLSWMPGGRTNLFEEEIQIGKIRGYYNDKSRIVFCHASGFISLSGLDVRGYERGNGGKGTNKDKRYRFNKKYRRNTAVWLDFTSQICTEIDRTMGRLGYWLALRDEVPVCISFLAARDNMNSDDQRVESITKALNRDGKYRTFQLRDSWRHQSAESPFLTVAGVFNLKGKKR